VLVAPVVVVIGEQVHAHAQRLHPRELRPVGHLAFTNWVAHAPLAPADAALMWEGMN